MSSKELKTVSVTMPDGGFTVQFPNKAALRHTLAHIGLDGGQVEEVMRHVDVVSDTPDFWEIELK